MGTGSVRGVRRTFMGSPDRPPSVAGNLMIGALGLSIPLAAQPVPNGTSALLVYEANSDLSDRLGSPLVHPRSEPRRVLAVAIALRDIGRQGSRGRPMQSRHVVAWVNLGMLYLAGVIGLVAQKWTVGGLLLAASVVLTFPLIVLERRDKRRGSD